MHLSRLARSWRLLAVVVVLGLLAFGTWRGTDDDFPVGPFHQFAGPYAANGIVRSTALIGLQPDGTEITLQGSATGYRRAELEGELPQLEREPDRLEDLAEAHHRLHPHDPPVVEIRIVQRRYEMRDGGVVGHHDVVLARWRDR